MPGEFLWISGISVDFWISRGCLIFWRKWQQNNLSAARVVYFAQKLPEVAKKRFRWDAGGYLGFSMKIKCRVARLVESLDGEVRIEVRSDALSLTSRSASRIWADQVTYVSKGFMRQMWKIWSFCALNVRNFDWLCTQLEVLAKNCTLR